MDAATQGYEYDDLLVIGTGPAGQRAAVQAAKLRKRVGIVERTAEPGGVCIAGSVYDQIQNKLSLHFRQLGEKSFKNIAQPIRTFSIEDTSPGLVPSLGQSGTPRSKRPIVAAAGTRYVAPGRTDKPRAHLVRPLPWFEQLNGGRPVRRASSQTHASR